MCVKVSYLENQFLDLWKSLNPDLPLEREQKLIPKRQFRFDFVYEPAKVVFEINGGVFAKMGHSTGKGINRDYQKLALAQMEGWRCFLLSSDMVSYDWVAQLGEFCRLPLSSAISK